MPGSGAPREAASAGSRRGADRRRTARRAPQQRAGRLYDALPGPKELVGFSAAEGAHLHCEPMGRARFEQRVFDWPAARLASGPPVRD
ncbi:hypothetical protein [Streptomyces nigrescens]